jgi:GR25 family glycosyltransferase involved in LPS biosynthesis
MFSAGIANTSLAAAELFSALGHETFLVNVGKNEWWDDCTSLKGVYKVVSLSDVSGLDLLIEIDRLMLSTQTRKRVTAASVLFLRSPFLLQEIEASLYPTTQTAKREYEGLAQIWLSDAAAAAEPTAIQSLELLSRVPVRIAPYLWTSSVAATHLKEMKIDPWLKNTVAELHRLHSAAGEDSIPSWKPHITEKNTTNSSSVTLPLVILREAKRRGVNLGTAKLHNTEAVINAKFFVENVKNHCTDAKGISGEFVGRQRCVEWALEPMSCVLAHLRFCLLRPVLLDVAWAGIPLVHNSPVLREIGFGLENTFYSENHVDEACNSFRRMEHDMATMQGTFAPSALENIRNSLTERFSPMSRTVQGAYASLIESLVQNRKLMAAVSPIVAAPTPVLVAVKKFRVGFCDMWENFDPEYNFFTLLLQAAGQKEGIEVTSGPATPTDSVVVFGPFGDHWRTLPADQPKVHFTGENTPEVHGPGVALNLGFQHKDMAGKDYLRFPLWLLEIDWFGADLDRIANPKPIPVERCTKVCATEVARKKKFCAFVVSNPTNPLRGLAFDWLNEYKPVDSAGHYKNTIGHQLAAGAGGGGGELLKHEFLKDYKFCIAYENASSPGYVTEKFLHAKAAGCIPIYWGDPKVDRDFSMAGAIDARTVRSKEELIALVRAVDESDSEWLKRYSVPALDSYKEAWAHRTMAECAKRIFSLGGLSATSFPVTVGDTKLVAAVAPAPVATAAEVPLVVTCANRRFLSSLQQWLTSVSAQRSAMPTLQARVYLFSDIPEDTIATLKESYAFAEFVMLPCGVPPEGAFPDFWAPEHYAWKIWIYKQLSTDPALAGKMILYFDAGAFLCRWPKEWMLKAQATGLCFLEDPRETNGRWCSKEFCEALQVTPEEKAAHQVLGGLLCFRVGEVAANLFQEALAIAFRREVIVGEKWAGTGPDGAPFGHRHDQSILSILALRAGAARHPLDTVYCDISLRKTFLGGKSIYVHRGGFKMHTEFAPEIDDAYVINLERRADRLTRLWGSSPELERRVERWPAIDGRKLQLTPALSRLLKPNDFFWKKAVTGCALSHLGLWWKLANETHDINSYLILEDDVKFRPGWEARWRNAVESGHVPDDYDIIYLGGVLPPNRAVYEREAKEPFNESFSRVKENTLWGQKAATRYHHFCAYSYVLSKRGAQKVIQLINTMDGFWTSADHVLCNPVDILKSYIFEPLVAGSYQDDDPAYANSDFNDFSRIDGFDSDLWNNDERFTGEEKGAVDGELDIGRALKDAAAPVTAVAPLVAPVATPPVVVAPVAAVAPAPTLTVQKAVGKPFRPLPRRFVCLKEQALDMRDLYEYEWLLHTYGLPSVTSIEQVDETSDPPTDCPIVVVQRPHAPAIAKILRKWDAQGAKFFILHLSDELGEDPIDMYELDSCVKVMRMYLREVPCPEKVLTIPLGYHWTLAEGSKVPLTHTPRLPFRENVWSFHGTDWRGRKDLLTPLKEVEPHVAEFYEGWNSATALKKDTYISMLLNTVFVPCPDGVNPETFRFYEALECGCVPLLVRTDANAAWVDWVAAKCKIIPMKSWADARDFVGFLMNNKEKLEGYRNAVLSAWAEWRDEVRREGVKWLQV